MGGRGGESGVVAHHHADPLERSYLSQLELLLLESPLDPLSMINQFKLQQYR